MQSGFLVGSTSNSVAETANCRSQGVLATVGCFGWLITAAGVLPSIILVYDDDIGTRNVVVRTFEKRVETTKQATMPKRITKDLDVVRVFRVMLVGEVRCTGSVKVNK
mmetsp:Transcript_14649/g.40448  ORF Transcript_14649/g.40448 Transcript_14649/m.40448 type:complete len:108 (-) Transcript_14649:44-367(-)